MRRRRGNLLTLFAIGMVLALIPFSKSVGSLAADVSQTEIGRLTVADPSRDLDMHILYNAPAPGRLVFVMNNPDGSQDGDFKVEIPGTGSPTLEYQNLKAIPTYIRVNGIYRCAGFGGLTSSAIALDVDAGPVQMRLSYSSSCGAENTGSDALIAYFTPMPVSSDGAELRLTFTVENVQAEQSRTVEVKGPGEIVVEATDVGTSGGGDFVYYLDGQAVSSTQLFTNSYYATKPYRVAIPLAQARSYFFRLAHEDDVWDDNQGTRKANVYFRATAEPLISEDTPTPTTDYSAAYRCPDTPPTRLAIGVKGFVRNAAADATPNSARLRDQAGKSGKILGYLPEAVEFTVIGGPACADGYVWWQIKADNGMAGWTAEGDKQKYYIVPSIAPQTPTPGPTYTPVVMAIPHDPAAYFPFDGNVLDASGHGSGVILYGATLTGDRLERPRRAYHFNGVDDHIKVPSNASLASMKSTMSILAWIEIDADASYAVSYDYRHIVSKGATYGALYADYALGLHADGSLLWENSNSANAPTRILLTPPISKGVWHHVAVTFDGGSIRSYLDGNLETVAQAPYDSIRNSSEALYIGCRYENPLVGAFQGAIDDVLIYDRVLSRAEIQKLYESRQ